MNSFDADDPVALPDSEHVVGESDTTLNTCEMAETARSSQRLSSTSHGSYYSMLSPADLHQIKMAYDLPPAVELRLPNMNELASTPSDGEWFCLYEISLQLGLRFPFPRFVLHLLAAFDLPPAQIMPNMWRILLLISSIEREKNIIVTPQIIESFFSLASRQDGGDKTYFLSHKSTKKLISELPTNDDSSWKKKYFFVKANPENLCGSAQPQFPMRKNWNLIGPKHLPTDMSDADKETFNVFKELGDIKWGADREMSMVGMKRKMLQKSGGKKKSKVLKNLQKSEFINFKKWDSFRSDEIAKNFMTQIWNSSLVKEKKCDYKKVALTCLQAIVYESCILNSIEVMEKDLTKKKEKNGSLVDELCSYEEKSSTLVLACGTAQTELSDLKVHLAATKKSLDEKRKGTS